MSSLKHLPPSLGYHGSIVNAESGKEKRYEIHDLRVENHSNWEVEGECVWVGGPLPFICGKKPGSCDNTQHTENVIRVSS